MGGSAYLIPAPYTGMSSRAAHLRRRPPSSEPGTDYYMPTGTPLRAPIAGRVVDVGGGIRPATGRYVTIDDGTRWLRFLHLAEWRCRRGDHLDQGDVFGISGASGYGSEFFGEPYRNAAFWRNTGGDHVHVTAFRGRGYTFGSSGTIDFHALTGGGVAAGGSTDPTRDPTRETESDMRVIKSPNRPPRVIAAGYARILNDEEAGNTVWPSHTLNDRQYDLNLSIALGQVATAPATGGMVIVEDDAKQRPPALIGPGYYRQLNAEELANAGVLAERRVTGNTRQYDLWVSMALAGQGASFPVTGGGSLSEADMERLASAIVKELPDGVALTAADIAKAVNDDAAKRLQN